VDGEETRASAWREGGRKGERWSRGVVEARGVGEEEGEMKMGGSAREEGVAGGGGEGGRGRGACGWRGMRD